MFKKMKNVEEIRRTSYLKQFSLLKKAPIYDNLHSFYYPPLTTESTIV